ncbi:MAG: hypothetical protein LBM26_00930 [Methanobrevibacter sp.]|nr:hypothetical protein [Methanobrevibacter sp.]
MSSGIDLPNMVDVILGCLDPVDNNVGFNVPNYSFFNDSVESEKSSNPIQSNSASSSIVHPDDFRDLDDFFKWSKSFGEAKFYTDDNCRYIELALPNIKDFINNICLNDSRNWNEIKFDMINQIDFLTNISKELVCWCDEFLDSQNAIYNKSENIRRVNERHLMNLIDDLSSLIQTLSKFQRNASNTHDKTLRLELRFINDIFPHLDNMKEIFKSLDCYD